MPTKRTLPSGSVNARVVRGVDVLLFNKKPAARKKPGANEEEEFGASKSGPKDGPSGAKSTPTRAAQDRKGPGDPPAKAKPQSGPPSTAVARRQGSGIQVAGSEEIQRIRKFSGRVLTAPGESVEATEDQRRVAAMLENGILLVDKDSVNSPHVSGLRRKLRQQGFAPKRQVFVDLSTIRKIYERATALQGEGQERGGTARMQQRFLQLVGEASEKKASDVHVFVDRHEAIVKLRVDGVMRNYREWPASLGQDLCQAAFNMADSSDASYKPLDYQGARVSEMATGLPEGVQSIRLQFDPLPNQGRYMIARILYSQADGAKGDVDELGYHESHIEKIRRMRRKSMGINVICGPTGSGKSTTLQRCLSSLMREKNYEVNVVTIEDPPEYVIDGAAQLPVTNAKNDEERREAFRDAIAGALRSDPDIIMIGEIRDAASAHLGFEAAMTGHGVWASLHANEAIAIIDRLRDLGIEPYKVYDASYVTGLIGQRLVRRLCDNCKIPFEKARQAGVVDDILDGDVRRATQGDVSEVYVGSGRSCDAGCSEGYKGRTVCAEVISPDDAFMDMMREGRKGEAINHWLSELGGISMIEHALMKLTSGQMDPRELEKVGDVSGIGSERAKRFILSSGPKAALTDGSRDDEEQETRKAG